MDYSVAATDSDQLGASPWGSSSPRAARTPFPPSAGSEPDSPVSARGQPYTQSQESLPAPAYSNQGSTQGAERGGHQDQYHPQNDPAEQQQAASIPDPNGPPQSLPAHAQYPGQPQPRPGAARYQSARQQRPVPQYKLQAKITALERTGRKDPVLRFDVHVCSDLYTPSVVVVLTFIDKSSQVSNYTIPRCPANAFRIPKASRPPHIFKSRSIRSRRTTRLDIRRGRHRGR